MSTWNEALSPGENVLWQGRPHGGLVLTAGGVARTIFGIFFAEKGQSVRGDGRFQIGFERITDANGAYRQMSDNERRDRGGAAMTAAAPIQIINQGSCT